MSSSEDSTDRPPMAERHVPVRIETTFIEERAEPASVMRLLNVILRHRRTVIAVPLIVATIVCSFTLLRPRTWSSSVSMVPSEPRQNGQLGQLSGLAAQFGVSIPLGGAGESPQFYQALLTSAQMRRQAVDTEYRRLEELETDTTWMAGTLVDFWNVRGRTPEIRVERAIEQLNRQMRVAISPETRMVRLSVWTRWPEVSLQISQRLIDLVEEFNVESRQSQASAEREFVESRLLAARVDLRGEEDVLKTFLEENRRLDNAPELRFERDRIQRRVNVIQEVVRSLAQALEQAKIEEVRNTPVITIVERPTHAVRPDRRRLIAKGFLSLAGGLFLGIVAAFAIEFVRTSSHQNQDEYEEFSSLVTDSRRDLRTLWRWLGSRLRPSRGTH